MRANAGDKDGKSFSMKDAYQIVGPNKEEYENSQMKNIWCQHIFPAYLKQPPPFFFSGSIANRPSVTKPSLGPFARME